MSRLHCRWLGVSFAILVCWPTVAFLAEPTAPPPEATPQAEESEDWEAVVRSSSAILDADPEDSDAYIARGAAYYSLAKYPQAIADLSEAFRRGVDSAQWYLLRASCYSAEKDWDRAQEDLSHALVLNPDDASTYRARFALFFKQGRWQEAIADLSKAIRLEPENALNYLMRASAQERQGATEAALADLEAALRLDPYDWSVYQCRALLEIEQGQTAQGRSDLATAVHLNPDDFAESFERWSKTTLTEADLEHGRKQVAQMLADRPAMRPADGDASPLCQWAVRKFAGEDLGHRIVWDAKAPGHHTTAENHPREPYAIRLLGRYRDGARAGEECSLDELWSGAVYELYNICNARQFAELFRLAGAGQLSKREFIAQGLTYEFHATGKSRAFYLHVFLPWAETQTVSSSPQNWYIGRPMDPKEAIRSVGKDDPVWHYYERMYDHTVLQAALEQGDYQRALTLAEEVRPQAKEAYEIHWLCEVLGCCYVRLDKPQAAISVLDEAIRLLPNEVDSYAWRACAYWELSDFQRCVTDCTKAIELKPSFAYAYRLRAAAYSRLGNAESAQADERMAAALESLSPSGDKNSEAPFSFRDASGPQYQSAAGPYPPDQEEKGLGD